MARGARACTTGPWPAAHQSWHTPTPHGSREKYPTCARRCAMRRTRWHRMLGCADPIPAAGHVLHSPSFAIPYAALQATVTGWATSAAWASRTAKISALPGTAGYDGWSARQQPPGETPRSRSVWSRRASRRAARATEGEITQVCRTAGHRGPVRNQCVAPGEGYAHRLPQRRRSGIDRACDRPQRPGRRHRLRRIARGHGGVCHGTPTDPIGVPVRQEQGRPAS